jgi:hypothetical protein
MKEIYEVVVEMSADAMTYTPSPINKLRLSRAKVVTEGTEYCRRISLGFLSPR